MPIEQIDPVLDRLVAADAEIKTLGDDFGGNMGRG